MVLSLSTIRSTWICLTTFSLLGEGLHVNITAPGKMNSVKSNNISHITNDPILFRLFSGWLGHGNFNMLPVKQWFIYIHHVKFALNVNIGLFTNRHPSGQPKSSARVWAEIF